MDNWFPQLGRGLFGVTLLLSWLAAFFQVSQRAVKAVELAPVDWSVFRAGCVVAAILLILQGGYLATAYLVPGWSQIAGIGWFYLVCAGAVPFLWAAGQRHEAALSWPQGQMPVRMKAGIIAGLTFAGLALSVILFSQMQVEAGEAVSDISDRASSTYALLLMVAWLIFNAPWIEELTFRHYLLPALARCWGGGRTAVVLSILLTAMIFSVGHAAHMDPAWPKLLQVGLWGIVLGCVRIWLGSLYCVALHLGWNLTAPVLAAMV